MRVRDSHAHCRWQLLLIVALCGTTFVEAAPPAGPDSPVSTSEVREFDVLVDGKAAGTHRLVVLQKGTTTTANIKTDVAIDFVVYTYRFKFRATEVWRDDSFVQVDARSEEGGDRTAVAAKADGSKCQVVFNGQRQVTDRSVMTTAYWRLPPEASRKLPFPILSFDTGESKSGRLEYVERATWKFESRSIPCRHFKVTGPSPADLWFDDSDRLVLQKSVEDGHPTELRLKRVERSVNDEPVRH